MVVETKFCVDCKHFKQDSIFRICNEGKGTVLGVNPVTGDKVKQKHVLCEFKRGKHGLCKPEGLLFEPKEVVTVTYNPSFFATIRSWFTNKE